VLIASHGQRTSSGHDGCRATTGTRWCANLQKSRLLRALVPFLLACGPVNPAHSSHSRADAGPRLERLATVSLAQNDSAFIAQPIALAIDPGDGSYYVADAFTRRATRWSRQGELLAAYGGAGAGPGELNGLWSVWVLDSTVVLIDGWMHQFKLYSRRTGAFIRTRNFTGMPWLIVSPQQGDTIWFGAPNTDRHTALLRWDTRADSLATFAKLPTVFFKDRRLGHFLGVPLALWHDTLLVGFSPLGLRLLDMKGDVLDTLVVPVKYRRGWSEEGFRGIDLRDGPAIESAASTVFDLQRLPNGEIVVVYYDYRLRETSHANTALAASIFVSLLSRDLRRACVDTELPVQSELAPAIQMRGDTLFVVSQDASGDSPRTSVALFRVTDDGCMWNAMR
jgi:hypothetical protein